MITVSLSKGGYVCSNCKTTEPILDTKVVQMIRLYYYVDITKISSLDIDKKTSDKIAELLDEYYDEYSGIYLKSKNFLKSLN